MKSVSVDKAAEEMDVSPDFIRRAIRKGELRAYKAGRAVRIYVESIEEYQKAREIRPTINPGVNRRKPSRASSSHWQAVSRLNSLIG